MIDLDDKTYDCTFLSDIVDLLKTGYFIIEVISIVILIVFSILDYSKVIVNGEPDEMKKSNQKLAKRIVIALIIFILPALVNFILPWFGINGVNSKDPLCRQTVSK